MNAKFILKLCLIILFLFSPQNAFADIYDDFNDGVIDTDKWGIFDYWYLEGQSDNTTPAVPVYEANGSLNIDYPPGSSYGGVRSKALFGGDFDFRTEWNWQYDGVSSTYEEHVAQIGINVQYGDSFEGGDSTHIFRGWESTFPEGYHDVYMSYAYVNSEWDSGFGNITTPTDTSGYLGIERVGSTINTYYSDTNHPNYEDWNLLNQVDNAFTEPVSLNLTAYTGDNTNSFHAEWDNVEIEADREVDIDFWNVGRNVIEWVDCFKTSTELLSALNLGVPELPLGMPLVPSIWIPPDILMAHALESDPSLIYQYPELFGKYRPTQRYVTFSPVDIQIIDSLGNSIGKTHNDFANALYFEGDLWNTGITNDFVLFWGPINGDYEINVIPELGASPEDIFSLLVFDDTIGQKYISTLAFGEEIINQNIKNYDYTTVSKTTPVPEPSSFLLLLSIGAPFIFSKMRRKIS